MCFLTVLHPYQEGKRSLDEADYEINENTCAVRVKTKDGRITTHLYNLFSGITPLTPPSGLGISPLNLGIRCI